MDFILQTEFYIEFVKANPPFSFFYFELSFKTELSNSWILFLMIAGSLPTKNTNIT